MLIFTADESDKAKMNFDKMGAVVARKKWKYKKRTERASADYLRSIV